MKLLSSLGKHIVLTWLCDRYIWPFTVVSSFYLLENQYNNLVLANLPAVLVNYRYTNIIAVLASELFLILAYPFCGALVWSTMYNRSHKRLGAQSCYLIDPLKH